MKPAAMLKLMGAKKSFEKNHPKFTAFVKKTLARGVAAGTVIEITLTGPGEEPVRTNIRVQESDLEFLAGLRELSEGGE